MTVAVKYTILDIDFMLDLDVDTEEEAKKLISKFEWIHFGSNTIQFLYAKGKKIPTNYIEYCTNPQNGENPYPSLGKIFTPDMADKVLEAFNKWNEKNANDFVSRHPVAYRTTLFPFYRIFKDITSIPKALIEVFSLLPEYLNRFESGNNNQTKTRKSNILQYFYFNLILISMIYFLFLEGLTVTTKIFLSIMIVVLFPINIIGLTISFKNRKREKDER